MCNMMKTILTFFLPAVNHSPSSSTTSPLDSAHEHAVRLTGFEGSFSSSVCVTSVFRKQLASRVGVDLGCLSDLCNLAEARIRCQQ